MGIQVTKEVKLLNNNMFFLIPSWGELIGHPTLGCYLSSKQKVTKIRSDPVIFFSGYESTVISDIGRLHFLFGLGFYSNKFEVQNGKYIIDNRELTSLVLSDFVYDNMCTATDITLQNDRDIIVNEMVINVPINLSHKTGTKKAFIQGSLMRNIFIPYKEIITEMMQRIQEDGFNLNKTGHLLLSTQKEYFNKILISESGGSDMNGYMKPTAGINDIIFGVDEYLDDIFGESMVEINNNIVYLKEKYSKLSYDPMFLFSILENASFALESNIPDEITRMRTMFSKKNPESISKELVFLTAKDSLNSVVDWPEQFSRRTKEQLENYGDIMIFKEVKPSKKIQTPEKSDIIEADEKIDIEEKYELRTLKNKFVEDKPLPEVPTKDINDILQYIRYIVEKDFEMKKIGEAFNIARENLRKIILHTSYMFEMSKYANILGRKEPNLAFNQREKRDILERIDNWIDINKNEI